MGFSLREIRQLVDTWYGKRISQEKKLAILDEKVRSIDEKIQQQKEMKKLVASFKEEVITFDC